MCTAVVIAFLVWFSFLKELFLGDQGDVVDIKVFYETLCPVCRIFFKNQLAPATQVLSPYLRINLFPYGIAETMDTNGSIKFTCQHGEEECYGNKLHACSIVILQNKTLSTLFNNCMMQQPELGSDDKGLEACADITSVSRIKILHTMMCAKTNFSDMVLKTFGDKTRAYKVKRVPTVYINNSELKLDDIMAKGLVSVICKQIKNPPGICKQK